MMNFQVKKTVTKTICQAAFFAFTLTACSASQRQEADPTSYNEEKAEESGIFENSNGNPPDIYKNNGTKKPDSPENGSIITPATPEPKPEPMITETDWAEYFGGKNGAAVLYDASNEHYTIYNPEIAATRRSPCSTFKIVSSLMALENGTIEPGQSIRKWSGEIFWNENWNRDLDFYEAFRTSCVWYFREVIDMIGQEKMQEELEQLAYGNLDITDWEGRQNTNNNNRALTGFWVESSLLISPKEQTEVMARIFGAGSEYSEETRAQLKKVMKTELPEHMAVSIYGKTGMGKAHGIVVDAWFTGFAENPELGETIYFCVYLGQSDGKNVSSTSAKEIAIRLISDYWTK